MVHSLYLSILLWTGIISAVSQLELVCCLPVYQSTLCFLPLICAPAECLSGGFWLRGCHSVARSCWTPAVKLSCPFLSTCTMLQVLSKIDTGRAVQPGFYKSVWKGKLSHRGPAFSRSWFLMIFGKILLANAFYEVDAAQVMEPKCSTLRGVVDVV